MSDVQQQPWAIRPITGSTIVAANVVGRDQVLEQMRSQLADGNNLLLADPRRMGKTSVLTKLCDEPGPGVDAVLVDLEGASSIDECFSRLIRALRKHTPLWTRVQRAVGSYVESSEVAAGPVTLTAVVAKRPVIDVLGDVVGAIDASLSGAGHELIIAIDELPMAIEAIQKSESSVVGEQLLHRLRHLRQSTVACRWVLAGSIGFHKVLRDVGATEGVVGDLGNVALGPLDTEDAYFLGRCLMLGIERDFDEGSIAAIADVCGGIPFLMHHVAHRLKENSGSVSQADVDAAFIDYAGDPDESRAMTHMLTRLGNDRVLKRVLDYLATNGPCSLVEITDHVESNDQLDRDDCLEIMGLLRDDHYVSHTAGKWGWKYDVLRRIWMIRRDLA